MAMGKKPSAGRQRKMWVAAEKLPRSPGHPFYERLNRVLEKAGFDAVVEGLCARFYADGTGRSSLRPGRYFRMLLLGYFEGLNSERDIAWRVADSMSVRAFLDLDPEETPPNHSTLSRTRRRIDVETHGEVFRWVLTQLAEAGLVRGKTIGIDATTLEANAAMRSLVRRDTGEDYERFVRGLAKATGVPTPTREERVRFDRKRKKKTTNQEWVNAHDPDAKITKLKDGRTRLSHKVEEAVDLETGAVVGGGDGAGGVGGPPDDGWNARDGAGGGEGGRDGSGGPGSGGGQGIPQQRYGSGVEGPRIAGVSVGNGSGPAELEGEEPEIPGGRVRESAADPGEAGATVAATEERVGGATVRAPVRHGRVASDLRPGPRQRAQATADPCLRIQSGIAAAPPDGGGYAPQSPGPRSGTSFYAFGGANRSLDRLGSALGAFLGVDPARFAVLGSSDPSINHLNISAQKEH